MYIHVYTILFFALWFEKKPKTNKNKILKGKLKNQKQKKNIYKNKSNKTNKQKQNKQQKKPKKKKQIKTTANKQRKRRHPIWCIRRISEINIKKNGTPNNVRVSCFEM